MESEAMRVRVRTVRVPFDGSHIESIVFDRFEDLRIEAPAADVLRVADLRRRRFAEIAELLAEKVRKGT